MKTLSLTHFALHFHEIQLIQKQNWGGGGECALKSSNTTCSFTSFHSYPLIYLALNRWRRN